MRILRLLPGQNWPKLLCFTPWRVLWVANREAEVCVLLTARNDNEAITHVFSIGSGNCEAEGNLMSI